jgi:uncharacterized repeat protein (TIGR01451 family)
MVRAVLTVKHFLLAALIAVLAAFGLPGTASANTCSPAATRGTAPSDYKDYCWLEFSGYSDAAALTAGGQPFTFNLPDGSSMSMTVNTTKIVGAGDPAIKTVTVPSWSGAAFGNTAFIGIPGQTVLYAGVNASIVRVTLSNISVTPPAGGTGLAKYALILADGESSNGGEALSFTTNGGAWVQLAQIQNGTSALYPVVTGVGTQTVTETGVAGTVGSFVFGSFNNPTQVSADVTSGGLQGFIVGVRYASISVVSQIAGQRYAAPDQFNYAIKSTAGATMATGATSGTALNGFTPAGLPTVAASYPFVIAESMVAGSTGALANYAVSLTCTNTNASSTTVLPNNSTGPTYTIASLQYGDAVQCTFTNTPIFSPIAGVVYSDTNHNASQDGTESGTAVSGLFVKLAPSSAGVCSGPATAAAAVNATTGAYSLPNVPPGSYCLILDNNNTLGDITAAVPPGWLGVQNPTGVIQVTVANTPPATPQNFGLYNGSRLSGNVFADTGLGAGTANNGVKDGGETGIANVSVKASAGAVVVDTAVTGGDGSYMLWVPATATGSVVVAPVAPAGYIDTGGSAGTTGGTYTRPSVSYAPAAGQSYTGANFGLVPPNLLSPNGAQSAQPGDPVFYGHIFQAGTAGQVTFTLANTSNPARPAWTQVLYLDSDCDGALAASEPQITAPLAVTADQKICLIVKQFVPANAAPDSKNTVTLSAALAYTNAAPALSNTILATDVTTVAQAGALALNKLVKNLSTPAPTPPALPAPPAISVNAAPGNTLEYSLTAVNNGTQALTTLVVSDATPAFTTYLSAACPGSLPAGITACNVTTQPAVGGQGGLQWTFTGSLASGAQLAVTYRVKVDQ